MALITRTNFSFIRTSIDKFWVLNSSQKENSCFIVGNGTLIGWELQDLHVQLNLCEILTHLSPKQSNGLLLSGQFYLQISLIDKHIPKLDLCITLLGWNWQKCDRWWLFSDFSFSENDLEKHIKFSTLLRTPEKMPWTVEVVDWNNVCGKPLNTRCKPPFSFIDHLGEVDQKLRNWAKNVTVLFQFIEVLCVFLFVCLPASQFFEFRCFSLDWR